MMGPSPRAADAVSEVESGQVFYSERADPLTSARFPVYHNCPFLLSADETSIPFLTKQMVHGTLHID